MTADSSDRVSAGEEAEKGVYHSAGSEARLQGSA